MATIPACTSVAMTLVSVGMSLASSGYITNVSARSYINFRGLRKGNLNLDTDNAPVILGNSNESPSNSDRDAHKKGPIQIGEDVYDQYVVKADGNNLYTAVVNAVNSARGLDEFKYENLPAAVDLRNEVGRIFASYSESEFESLLQKVRRDTPGADALFKDLESTRTDLKTAKQKYMAQHMENISSPSSVSKMLIGSEFEAAAISATPLFSDREGELQVHNCDANGACKLNRYWKGKQIATEVAITSKWVARIFFEENQYGMLFGKSAAGGAAVLQPAPQSGVPQATPAPAPASPASQGPSSAVATRPAAKNRFDVMIEVRDYIEKAQKEGLKLDTRIPKFVVFGAQSSGKSRLIEALAKMKFNFVSSCGMATTVPTHIRFKPNRKVKKSIVYLGEKKIVGGEEEIVWPAEPIEEEELMKKMQQMQTASNFSIDPTGATKVHLRIEGPDVYDIEIVDLPGYQATGAEGDADKVAKQNENIDNINALARTYLSDERNHIIMVDPAQDANLRKFFHKLEEENLLVKSGKQTREEYHNFLRKRMFWVQTKLDNYKKIKSFKLPSLEKWLSHGGAQFVPDEKKFAFQLPVFKSTDEQAHDTTVCEGKVFMEKLKICNEADQEVAHEIATKMASKGEAGEIIAEKYTKAFGFTNFEVALKNKFFDLFKQEVEPTLAALKGKRTVLSEEIAKLQHKLKDAKKQSYTDAPGHLAWSISQIAIPNSIHVAREGNNFLEVIKGVSIVKDNEDFIKKSLFKDASHDYYKMDAGHRSSSSSTTTHEVNEVVEKSFRKHAEDIAPLHDYQSNNYGGEKINLVIKEMRAYISSQVPEWDEDLYVKFLKDHNFNPYGTQGDNIGKKRERITKDFLHERVLPLLKHNLAAVGHRIVKTFQQMFDTAIVHLNAQTSAVFGIGNAEELADTGDALERSKVLKKELQKRYNTFLNKLFDDYRRAYEVESNSMFFDWKKLVQKSYMDILDETNDPFLDETALAEIDEAAWERKEQAYNSLDHFLNDSTSWTVTAVPDEFHADKQSIDKSLKRSARQLFEIVKEVSGHARATITENFEDLVHQHFVSRITDLKNASISPENLNQRVSTDLKSALEKGDIVDCDEELAAKLKESLRAAQEQKSRIDEYIFDLETVV